MKANFGFVKSIHGNFLKSGWNAGKKRKREEKKCFTFFLVGNAGFEPAVFGSGNQRFIRAKLIAPRMKRSEMRLRCN